MKYLYLKLGRSNNQLEYWLQENNKKNIFERPSAVIYFGDITTEACKNLFHLSENELKSKRIEDKNIPKYTDLHYQLKPFIEAMEKKDTRFISIHNNKVFILEPEGEIRDMKDNLKDTLRKDLKDNGVDEKNINDIMQSIPKMLPVKIIKEVDENIPYILRTFNINQYFNRGTCREIKEKNNWEVLQAIKYVLNEKLDNQQKITSQQLFRLLSPHQFETLVFLILTNAGLYSPAWRAGSFPIIDIVGRNCSNKKSISIGTDPPIVFEKDKEITFQVKRKNDKKKQNVDYTIALTPLREDNYNGIKLNSEWLIKVIKTENQQKTREWLEYSLKWFMKDSSFKSIFELVSI